MISIAILIAVFSIGTISAADADNATDAVSAEEVAVDDADYIQAANPEESVVAADSQNEILGIDENSKDTHIEATYKEKKMTGESSSNTQTASNTIKSDDNVKPIIKITHKGRYFGRNHVKIRVLDSSDKTPVDHVKVTLKFSNKYKIQLKTNSKGIITFRLPFNPGKYKMSASYNGVKTYKKILIKKTPAIIKAKRLVTYYGEKYFTVKVLSKNSKKGIYNAKVLLKVGDGKDVRKFHLKTNSYGIAKCKFPDLKAGKHKIVVTCSPKQVDAEAKQTAVKMKRTPATIKARNATYEHSMYRIHLTNSATHKKIPDARILIKIAHGDKVKTLHKRTDKMGNVKLDLYYWPDGTYKMLIKCENTAIKAAPVKTIFKLS